MSPKAKARYTAARDVTLGFGDRDGEGVQPVIFFAEGDVVPDDGPHNYDALIANGYLIDNDPPAPEDA